MDINIKLKKLKHTVQVVNPIKHSEKMEKKNTDLFLSYRFYQINI